MTGRAGGSQFAAYQPETETVEGTGLAARAREDGSGYDVGDDMSLSAAGAGEVTTADGGMFRVMRNDGGMLMGTRYDMDMAAGTLMVANAKVMDGENPDPALTADNRETDFNEKNTGLKALGGTFSMGDLLGSGFDAVDGPNIVAEARAALVKIRERVEGLVALNRDQGISDTLFTSQVLVQWGKADDEIDKIFGATDDERLERVTSPSRVVDQFNRVIAALDSEESLAAATLKGGPDKLDGFNERNATQAAQIFNRLKWTAAARFGALGSTRFGAAMWNQTTHAQAGPGGADRAQAFAWSTMRAVRRAGDLGTTGGASYSGETLAADQAGNLYSGEIAIDVRLARMTVNGLISSFARADTGNPWTHGLGGEVVSIHLPTADLTRRGGWDVTTKQGDDTGRLQYGARAGGEPDFDLPLGATYKGQLLGRGDQSGAETIGTWSLTAGSTTLAGGFGATRDAGPYRPPPGTAVTEELGAIGKSGTVFATQQTAGASTVLNTANAKFKYTAPAMAGGGKYVADPYQPVRADVLEAEDWEGEQGNWVATARAAIETKYSQLVRVIALDNADASADDRKFANDQRQRLFNEIRDEIRKVFGPDITENQYDDIAATTDTDESDAFNTGVLTVEPGSGLGATAKWTAHTDYPVNNSGDPEDAGVRAEIEDVLEALGDADAFAAAFDSGGIFAGARAGTAGRYPNGYPGAATVFNRPRGKLVIASASTDYTRFGAWRHEVSEYATDGLKAQGSELGAFAYSPFGPTEAYGTVSNRLYPASNGKAEVTYAGDTVAAQGDQFYRGKVEATAYWNATAVGDSDIRVTITDLENTDSGDPLMFGYARDGFEEVGTIEVESLEWRADITDVGQVKFMSQADVTLRVTTIDGQPNWRPVPGSAFVEGMNFKRFERPSGGHHLRYGTSETNYFAAVTDGTGSGVNGYGELSFDGLGTADTPDATITQTGQPYMDARDAFNAGQVSLAYPKWMIQGPRIQPVASTGVNDNRNSIVLLYADGSTRHIDHYANFNSAAYMFDVPNADGTVNRAASSMKLTYVSGKPLLSAEDNLRLYNDIGQPWSKDILTDDAGMTIGQGAPDPDTMQPGDIALAWLKANDYVNVVESDPNALNGKIEGMFVGQDQDGPLGIIGTWELTGEAFGTGTERGDIRGAFGLDFTP